MTESMRKIDLLLLVAMLVLAVLVSVAAVILMPPARAGSIEKQPSTFFNASYGTKAAYMAIQQMGYSATRLRRPIDDDTLDGVKSLVILRPIQAMTQYEHDVLLRWVRDGHILLVAPSSASQCCQIGESAVNTSDWFHLVHNAPDPKSTIETIRTTVHTENRDTLLEGVTTLLGARGQRFDTASPVAGPLAGLTVSAVWTDELGVVAARIRCGEGTIIALADVYALTNEGLSHADNPVFLANLAWELTGGRTDAVLAFDEYHAGFPYHEPSWLASARLMFLEGWGWSVGHALLLGALALYAHGVRFGSLRDVRLKPRRRHGEFTAAAGRLLHDAGASDLAYEVLYKHYRSQICGALNLSRDTNEASLASALISRGCAELAETLPRMPAMGKKRITRRDVLELSEKMHGALEILQNGA